MAQGHVLNLAKAGTAYFSIVFLAGFTFGAIRVLLVAPQLGEAAAILLEFPLMLIVSWIVSQWSVRRFRVPAAIRPRAAMGGLAFVLLMFSTAADGEHALTRAAALGDVDALSRNLAGFPKLSLSVLSEFRRGSYGTIFPSHFVHQVELARLRASTYMEFPTEVHIETQAVCNAKCNFCPYPTMDRQGDKMSDALIEKIVDDLKAIPLTHRFAVAPFKVNDPLLDKRIFKVCADLNRHLPNAQLRLFTNGSPLTDAIVEKIADVRNLVNLWVSLNASERSEYETLMQLPFERTIANLDRLHERVASGYPHKVVLSRVADNSPSDRAFVAFVAKRYPLFKSFLIGRNNWTGQVEAGVNKGVPPTGCTRWYEVSIMASGKVALCCMDGKGEHVIGDVNNQSVLEIYNSPSFRKMREYATTRLDAAAPCNTCAY